MKQLHDKVNIIPVIGKSDACTQQEIKEFKATVSKDTCTQQEIKEFKAMVSKDTCTQQEIKEFKNYGK